MARKRVAGERGVTLMEVTMAVAIFAAVIAVTAQSLMSFYVTMDSQEQRIEAVQSCRAVLGALREKRDEFSSNFPAGLLGWINSQNEANWAEYLRTGTAHEILKNNTLTVNCFGMGGAAASDADNPIQVLVVSRWTDRKGRPMEAEVTTILTAQ
jgi:prepilin-type N-terminal cleavage/methylation domain-containing protein